MKKFSEKLLKEITSKVKNAALNKNLSSYELSIQLWEAKNVINWKLTSYGSWKVFVEKELRVMSYTCICKYLTVINKIRKFDYLDKDCRYMITELGWARFMVCVILQKRRMDPKRFVTKYYNFDTNYQNPNRSRAHGDRAYTFALPTEQADVIDGYLLNMGMTVGPNGGRRGVREAFIKLIDTELES